MCTNDVYPIFHQIITVNVTSSESLYLIALCSTISAVLILLGEYNILLGEYNWYLCGIIKRRYFIICRHFQHSLQFSSLMCMLVAMEGTCLHIPLR